MKLRRRSRMQLDSWHVVWPLGLIAISGCDSRPDEFGGYSGDGKTRLPEYSVQRETLDCYKTAGFNLRQLTASGAEIDTATAPLVSKPEILVFIADESIGDKYQFLGESTDQQICGCGKCTRHLWWATRELETVVKPLGKGLFRVTTPTSLRSGVHMLFNTATTKVYVFRTGGESAPVAPVLEQRGSSAPLGDSKRGTVRERRSALESAISKGDANSVRRLASDRQVVNTLSANGATLLMGAAQSGNAPIVRILLSSGADARVKAPGSGDAFGGGYTALTLAVAYNHAEVVKLLLEAGADPNSVGSYGGSVLVDAMAAGQHQIVGYLTSAGARLSATPAMLVAAAGGGFTDEVRRLIAGGVKVNQGAGYKGSVTALMAAAKGGHAPIVQFLIGAGADLNPVDDAASRTPLGHAAAEGHAEIVSLLIRAGAALAGQSTGNIIEPPLHAAAESGHADVVRILLAAGADPTERFSETTAFEAAQRQKHSAVVSLLAGDRRH